MSGSSRCDGEGGRGYLRHVSRVSYDSTWWPASGLEKKGSTGTNRDERGLESVESVLEAWDLCQHRYVPVLQPDLGAVLILVCLIVRLGNDMAPKPHPFCLDGVLYQASNGHYLSIFIWIRPSYQVTPPLPPAHTHA